MVYLITPELRVEHTSEEMQTIKDSIDAWVADVHPFDIVMTIVSYFKRIHKDDINNGLYKLSKKYPDIFSDFDFIVRNYVYSYEIHMSMSIGANNITWTTYGGRWDGYYDIDMRKDVRKEYREKFIRKYGSEILNRIINDFIEGLDHFSIFKYMDE